MLTEVYEIERKAESLKQKAKTGKAERLSALSFKLYAFIIFIPVFKGR